MPGQGNPLLVNMIIGSLRPHVPEYTDVVMAELAKPKNQTGFKESIRSRPGGGIKNTFSAVDMTAYSSILKRHGCSSEEVCEQTLGKQIEEADERITRYYLIVLGSVALGFVLLTVGKRGLSRPAVAVLMLFCIVLLAGGVLSPMLEVEVRINRLNATLLGTPSSFASSRFTSEARTCSRCSNSDRNGPAGDVDRRRAGPAVQRGLPAAEDAVPERLSLPAGVLRTSRIVKFFAFESSKWSMADVMALAIFMSFVAFNGLIGSAMDDMSDLADNWPYRRTIRRFCRAITCSSDSVWRASFFQRSWSAGSRPIPLRRAERLSVEDGSSRRRRTRLSRP